MAGVQVTSREHAVFVRNDGQWARMVEFRAGCMLSVFLETNGITWSQLESTASQRLHHYMHLDKGEMSAFKLKGHAWHVEFLGASQLAKWEGVDRGAEYLNFLLGNDRSKWVGHVPIFTAALNSDLWPGVDLVMRSEGGSFKYDLMLDQSSDVEKVRFEYTGPESMRIDARGFLIIRTSVGDIAEAAPVAYYADGRRESVRCRYVLSGRTLSFTFDGHVDTGRPIVIDPTVLAATYSGTGDLGMTENYGGSATYGADGSIFTGAHCFSQGYPTSLGAFQLSFPGGPYSMAISKLSADGSTLNWATYLGGDGNDTPASLIEAADGSLVIMGTSNSENYPCSYDAYDDTWGGGLIERDIVVSRLSQDGATLMGSTYIGGDDDDGWNGQQQNIGDHVIGEVVLDDAGDIYLCNTSWSTNFPTTPGALQSTNGGAQDAVVLKLSADLSTLVWSTRLGGEDNDVAYGLHLDGTGGAYVVGSTGDGNLPFPNTGYQSTFAGVRDGFVAHVVDNGTAIAASTYFGGDAFDQLQRVDLDAQGAVFVLGQHASQITSEPSGIFNAGDSGVVVARLSADLSTLELLTCVATNFAPSAFMVDECGRVYVSGYDPAFDIPITTDAVQTNPEGYYVGVYDTGLVGQLFGSYFGLLGDHQDAGMSRFNSAGVLYQALCEDGWPGVYPTTSNAWSITPAESFDVVVFKLDTEVGATTTLAAFNEMTADSCAPMMWDFSSIGVADSWTWDFGDGSVASVGPTVAHIYGEPGMYEVALIVGPDSTCGASDTATVIVAVPECVGTEPVEIVVPNVFTPNGDGENDLFHITGIDGIENHLRIFNRWGAVVLDASNYRNSWNGGGVSDGTYYYLLELPARGDSMTGHLTILQGDEN